MSPEPSSTAKTVTSARRDGGRALGDGGRPVPSRLAEPAEVVEICRALQSEGHGVLEFTAGSTFGHAELVDLSKEIERPVILAGIRVSVTIAIGTATIGSTVGALTLGTPIFDGLVANKLPFVIEGAVLVALFAILTDMLFGRLDRWLRRGTAG